MEELYLNTIFYVPPHSVLYLIIALADGTQVIYHKWELLKTILDKSGGGEECFLEISLALIL